MTGYILLEGGAEFGGKMAEPDTRAIELAGGPGTLISIIPTAAAPDNNWQRAGSNGVRWFQSLGATRVELVPLIDKVTANDAAIADVIRQSRLIYMLGGFTGYLGETLSNSLSWQAMLQAYEAGAVIAGSSAGAMVLCQYYYDPARSQASQGLGLVPNSCVLPHHNTFGKGWAKLLTRYLPDAVLLGIDERTGMTDDGGDVRKTDWRVYGEGVVSIYRGGQATEYEAGKSFKDDFVS
ncbi:MAG TPA: Type 1 glutamine amidotransferase-like domain-containing protein [Ktedonobacteraceae bacterium]|jgi:cyanophycinase|nr:Type 1 glutamine amidotransferase-like domain-containing protein [Ktedonobacteraceae bacterium]